MASLTFALPAMVQRREFQGCGDGLYLLSAREPQIACKAIITYWPTFFDFEIIEDQLRFAHDHT